LWKSDSVDETPRSLRAGLAITALAIAPHDHLIAVGAGKYFSLWNYQQGKREFATPSRDGNITCMAYSPTEREICWGAGRSVQCFDTTARRASARLDDLPGNVLSLAYTPDATRIFVALANDQLMLCWMNQRSGKFE
jgi:WD40 repeat protein